MKDLVQYFCDYCDPSDPCLDCENRNAAERSHHIEPDPAVAPDVDKIARKGAA